MTQPVRDRGRCNPLNQHSVYYTPRPQLNKESVRDRRVGARAPHRAMRENLQQTWKPRLYVNADA